MQRILSLFIVTVSLLTASSCSTGSPIASASMTGIGTALAAQVKVIPLGLPDNYAELAAKLPATDGSLEQMSAALAECFPEAAKRPSAVPKWNGLAPAPTLNVDFTLETIELHWDYVNPGDYDQNGEVNAADLGPMGLHFGETVTDPRIGAGLVDGDGNGVITGADMVAIGANFHNSIAGYVVEGRLKGETELNELMRVPFSDGLHQPALGRLVFDASLHVSAYDAFAVAPYDKDGTTGAASALVGIEKFLPDTQWIPPSGHWQAHAFVGGLIDPGILNIPNVTDYSWDFVYAAIPRYSDSQYPSVMADAPPGDYGGILVLSNFLGSVTVPFVTHIDEKLPPSALLINYDGTNAGAIVMDRAYPAYPGQNFVSVVSMETPQDVAMVSRVKFEVKYDPSKLTFAGFDYTVAINSPSFSGPAGDLHFAVDLVPWKYGMSQFQITGLKWVVSDSGNTPFVVTQEALETNVTAVRVTTDSDSQPEGKIFIGQSEKVGTWDSRTKQSDFRT